MAIVADFFMRLPHLYFAVGREEKKGAVFRCRRSPILFRIFAHDVSLEYLDELGSLSDRIDRRLELGASMACRTMKSEPNQIITAQRASRVAD